MFVKIFNLLGEFSIGSALLWVGGKLFSNYWMSQGPGTESAIGVVIDNQRTEDSEGNYFAPVVEFAVDGKTFRFVRDWGSCAKPEFEIGQTVTVHFPIGQPELATMRNPLARSIAIIPFFLGLCLLVDVTMRLIRHLL